MTDKTHLKSVPAELKESRIICSSEAANTADTLKALQSRIDRLERVQRHQRTHYEWRDACTLTAAIFASVAASTAITLLII